MEPKHDILRNALIGVTIIATITLAVTRYNHQMPMVISPEHSPACVKSADEPCAATNICGMTSMGTKRCDGSCSITAPDNSLCTPATPPSVLGVSKPVDFLDIAIGDTATHVATVKNEGTDNLNCTASIVDTSGHFTIPHSGGKMGDLSAGTSTDIHIVFAPTDATTSINATLRVICVGSAITRDVALYGRGALALSLPNVINLGETPAGTTRYFNLLSIKNNKSLPAEVCIIVPRENDHDRAFACDEDKKQQCSKQIGSGGASKFKLSFSPVALARMPSGYREPMSTTLTVGTLNSVGKCVPMSGGINTIIVNATAVEPIIKFNEK